MEHIAVHLCTPLSAPTLRAEQWTDIDDFCVARVGAAAGAD